MENKASGGKHNKACELCTIVHDDGALTTIYGRLQVCPQCAANPDLEKVARVFLATSYAPADHEVVLGMIRELATQLKELKRSRYTLPAA